MYHQFGPPKLTIFSQMLFAAKENRPTLQTETVRVRPHLLLFSGFCGQNPVISNRHQEFHVKVQVSHVDLPH